MRRGVLARVAVVSAMFVALTSTGGTALAASPTAPDVAIAGPDGQFVGGGVVDPTGVSQRVAFDVVSGRTAAAAIRISNPADDAQTFVLRGSSGGKVFRLRYRDGSTGVTSQVTSGGYGVSLGPGASRTIDVTVAASPTSRKGQHGGFRFPVTNVADPARADVGRAQVAVAPIRVSSRTSDGRLRCVATFPTRTLVPGSATNVGMAFHNLTNKKLIAGGFGFLEVFDLHGNLVGTSPITPFGPPPFPRNIPPHSTRKIELADLRVRWSGPLRVHPVCEGARKMGSVVLQVASPEPPTDDASAIAAAVDTPGSPFQACRPGPNGEQEKGTFAPPDGRHIAPLQIRCWADIQHEQGFDVVGLNMVSPWSAPATTLDENHLGFVKLPGHGDAFAARWGFVVTADGARPYLALGASRGVGEGKSYEYDLSGGHWTPAGWTRCGFDGFFVWFYGTGFSLEFVDACHPPNATGATPPVLHGTGSHSFGDAGFEVRRPLATRSS